MRGILQYLDTMPKPNRITPAHAGNTLYTLELVREMRDHPRTCGEYHCPKPNPRLKLGSPPHMRGIQADLCGERIDVGITPAHAGNTSTTTLIYVRL